MKFYKSLIKSKEYTLDSKTKSMKNLFQFLDLKEFEKLFSDFYQNYTVEENEKPELVSRILYGSTEYYYLIIFANQIKDIYKEWPMDELVLLDYIKEKYGSISNAKATVKKYYNYFDEELTEISWNNLSDINKYTVSAYEYEIEQNEAKRNIKVIKPIYLDAVKKALRNYMKTGKYAR